MAARLMVNGKVYELESPGHLCLGFCLFDGSYPIYDEPPQRLSVPYTEIRARTPRPKDELQKDLDSIWEHVYIVQRQLSCFKEPLDRLTDEQWLDCRKMLIELIERLVAIRGIGLSLATKILHRYFPHLMPIIDEICVGQKHGYRGKTSEVMDLIRKDMILSQSTIDEALLFISGKLRRASLTRVRVFDILLWTIMNTELKKIGGVYTQPISEPTAVSD